MDAASWKGKETGLPINPRATPVYEDFRYSLLSFPFIVEGRRPPQQPTPVSLMCWSDAPLFPCLLTTHPVITRMRFTRAAA